MDAQIRYTADRVAVNARSLSEGAMTESDFLLWLNREYSGAERKTGKWIDHSEDGYVECPLCGHLTTCDGNIEDLHYCFWCGTRLEVEE